jgi:hypothetical protein
MGTGVGAGALILTENISADDLLGFIPLMFVSSLLLCSFFYVPGMFWLKHRKGCTSVWTFPLVAGFVLNIPILVFLLFALSIGKFFSGLSEVLLFGTAFVVTGLIFGRGFAWYCRGCGMARTQDLS